MLDNTDRSPFLGVSSSLTGRRWVERIDVATARTADAIAQRIGVSEIVARVIAARGVTVEAAEDFLEPSIRRLMPDPSTLTDMDAATERIADAIVADTPIAIFGDYDVDGATSSALILRYLRTVGRDARVHIPDRIFEGYGPNIDALRNLADEGAKLLICVDCGSSSHEALSAGLGFGLEAIVVDHHQMGPDVPPAVAVVNPNRQDDLSGLGHLAAVGVSFLTVVAVNRALRRRGYFGGSISEPDLLQWLDLVALGTVCDVVPLVGLNRAFVVKGLRAMAQRENAGVAALSDKARLSGPLRPYHLGFLLGPRLNAGGRIGDASLGSRLLSSIDPEECQSIAETLERLNQERQSLEARMLEEAFASAEAQLAADPKVAAIITHDRTWHPGVVGLIASRLKDRFHRPALAFSGTVDGDLTGSGRSVPGIDLGAIVREAVATSIAIKGGGHGMAAGITVAGGRLDQLAGFVRKRIEETGERLSPGDLKLDGALSASGANIQTIEALERGGPYGAGNAEPVFAIPGHHVGYSEKVGNGGHVRVSLRSADGTTLKAMAFRAADQPIGRALLEGRGRALHVAGSLSVDHWQGRATPSLRIIDVAEPSAQHLKTQH